MNPVLKFVIAIGVCLALAYGIERLLDRVGEWWLRPRQPRRRRPVLESAPEKSGADE